MTMPEDIQARVRTALDALVESAETVRAAPDLEAARMALGVHNFVLHDAAVAVREADAETRRRALEQLERRSAA